ncbi:hypothetical protein ACS127_18185 [Amphibacillus sp. Q70]|uniref:hypothetical protein n=1 Tax=Amphibacillus sp. Q70 TaxID=3453416 RepID=UPI003F851F7F
MALIINSPMQPTIFRQRILSGGEKRGYLAVTNIFEYLKGRNSFKAKFNDTTIFLLENGKERRKRNWSILVEKNGIKKDKGLVTMDSSTVDTLRTNETYYKVEFDGTYFELRKPFMEPGKEEAFLYDNNNIKIANIILSLTEKPRFKKVISISNLQNYTNKEIGFFVVLLNTAIFES